MRITYDSEVDVLYIGARRDASGILIRVGGFMRSSFLAALVLISFIVLCPLFSLAADE